MTVELHRHLHSGRADAVSALGDDVEDTPSHVAANVTRLAGSTRSSKSTEDSPRCTVELRSEQWTPKTTREPEPRQTCAVPIGRSRPIAEGSRISERGAMARAAASGTSSA